MYIWTIGYRPAFHQFTRLFVSIRANSYEAAMMKFYSKYDDECLEVLSVERFLS